MRKTLLLIALLFAALRPFAQVEPTAGNWKTWFISSIQDYGLPAPLPAKQEISEVLQKQGKLDSAGWQQILYWNAGSPGYRWQEMIDKIWMTDTGRTGVLANMVMATSIYDATIAAWDSKYRYNRLRPYEVDKRIKALITKPTSPSYPCEHSVAAAVASTVIAHFYPKLADSVKKLAEQAMDSRIAAGVVFPGDTRAGYELGKKVAEQVIELTKQYVSLAEWDGKRPEGSKIWAGNPMFPMAGKNKTMVLDSASQFRPVPPPDFEKEMDELRKAKPGFRSMANAFFFASQNFWQDALHKKIFEYNLDMNPPRAARIYASAAVGAYDAFASCWDAKYAYWGTRPDQYDTTYRPIILHTPPFPGYPSGHAMMSGLFAELYSYYFPAERTYFMKRAKDAADSRFQAGIHFRSDNEVGLEMGKKVGAVLVKRVMKDGADGK